MEVKIHNAVRLFVHVHVRTYVRIEMLKNLNKYNHYGVVVAENAYTRLVYNMVHYPPTYT